jgi:hypothetical protein
MNYTVETDSSQQTVLVMAKTATRFVHMLKRKLESYDNQVVLTDTLPHKLTPYFTAFFFNPSERMFREIVGKYDKRMVFIFFDQREMAQRCLNQVAHHKKGTIKIINLETSFDWFEKDIETIFWFSFAPSEEIFLPIHHPKPHIPTQQQKKVVHRHYGPKPFTLAWLNQYLQPKYTITFILSLIVVIHLLFVPALGIATFFHYKAAKAIETRDFESSKQYLAKGSQVLNVSQFLYSYVRPTYSLFSVGIIPDNIFVVNQTLSETITQGINIYQHGKEFQELFMQQNKSPSQVEYMAQLKDNLFERLTDFNQNLMVLEEKLPSWNKEFVRGKQELNQISDIITLSQRFFPYFDSLFARNGEKNYLILFANNMELRPGGGFIGSFAVLKLKNYSISELKVYDVYDADGQLVEHVDAPKPIQDYLEQPHWFLRDSAFSADFSENYDEAKFFLEKSMGMERFDGVILVTTTAIQNILGAMETLYIPDFRESVNADNFYIKAQLHAEKDFFPGSHQKKTFLASVMNQMMIALPDASPTKLFEAVKKSLDEKQIVAFFDDPDLQRNLDSMYWSGRTIKPGCSSTNPNCIADYVFPYDANLGVNKANFFITKSEKLRVNVGDDGKITHHLSIKYKNDSYENIFPGGTYKNYFQILLPSGVQVNKITVNGKVVNTYDLKSDNYARLGFLTTVEPKSQTIVEIDYTIEKKLSIGSGVYQLIVQKQIGSPNSDLQLEIQLPKHTYVTNKNFSPLVKDHVIHYNTSLSADKIFYIEFYLEKYDD